MLSLLTSEPPIKNPVAKVAWDVSHLEFTIEDPYYFSKLRRLCHEKGILIEEIRDFQKLADYDVVVFNYPELKFSKGEIKDIETLLLSGKRVIFTGYCMNEDGVNENINKVLNYFGLNIFKDIVLCKDSEGDNRYFPCLNVLGIPSVRKVVMPCASSVGGEGATAFIKGDSSTITAPTNVESPIVGVVKKYGKGELIVLGTCVFWDNFSIDKADNKKLAFALLSKRKIEKK